VGQRLTEIADRHSNQTSYTYNNMNQMTAAGNITFTYDSNGNTASKTENQATANYTWDYENALSKIDNPSGDDYIYEYDGEGMRVRAGHDSGQGNVWDSRFYYDVGTSPYAYLFESDNDKTMTAAYTSDPYGSLVSQRRGGSTYYHLYDQLGSTRQLLNSNQATTDSYSYYAFGEVRSSSGSTTNPFNFVGRLGYYDDPSTDFQYLRARYYGPGYGRFLSVDPTERAGTRYLYVANRVLGARDPSGRKICWIWPFLPWFPLPIPWPVRCPPVQPAPTPAPVGPPPDGSQPLDPNWPYPWPPIHRGLDPRCQHPSHQQSDCQQYCQTGASCEDCCRVWCFHYKPPPVPPCDDMVHQECISLCIVDQCLGKP
jgi:RHS repeat-associated protein